jgi:hypothetical protein
MNKRIAIPIIGVLVVGLIATGVFYLQGTNELEDAQDEIAGLQGDVSGLEGDLAATEADLAATEEDLAVSAADLAVSEADLAEAEDLVSDLETEIDQANSAAQTQQNLNLTLSEELAKAKDPRHFESLEELEAWLAQDDTDTRIRFTSISPEERAFILQVRALRDGYLLSASFEDFNFDGLLDLPGNMAYIGDEIYWIRAADDFVVLFVRDVPPIPSHPLPEE